MSAALFPEITVNGEVIPSIDIASEAQNHPAPEGKPGLAWRKAAQALAIRALMLQEATRRGVKAEPMKVGKGKFETDEEALIRSLLEEEIVPPAPKDEEVRALWEKNPDRFRAPPLWEVSHILIAAKEDDPASLKAAHLKARALTKTLEDTPKEFSKLAAIESDCGSKSSGGALGQLTAGDTVPAFETALHTLAEGEITASPVQTPFGWHVIRMDACSVGEALPYEAVKPHIQEAAEKSAWAHAAQDFAQRLIADASIQGIQMQSL